MSNPTPCLWNVRWDCPNNGLALEGIRTAPIDPLNATKAPFIPMTDDILTAAQEGLRLAEKATKGPWDNEKGPYIYAAIADGRPNGAYIAHFRNYIGKDLGNEQHTHNAAFAAHAGTHHATLCRELLRLHEERERLRAALKEIVKGEGPFSIDAITHAENVINRSIELASATLAQTGEEKT